MGDLERIEAKVDWLVDAMKHLLSQEIDPELTEDWEPPQNGHVEEVPDHIAVRRRPKAATQCTHQHQTLVDGVIRCARCGYGLLQSGVLNDPSRYGDKAARTEWGQFSVADAPGVP